MANGRIRAILTAIAGIAIGVYGIYGDPVEWGIRDNGSLVFIRKGSLSSRRQALLLKFNFTMTQQYAMAFLMFSSMLLLAALSGRAILATPLLILLAYELVHEVADLVYVCSVVAMEMGFGNAIRVTFLASTFLVIKLVMWWGVARFYERFGQMRMVQYEDSKSMELLTDVNKRKQLGSTKGGHLK